MQPIRVVDLETTGSRPPAHAVCEVGWQDLVPASDGSWTIAESSGAFLIDPGRDIPAVTQAVHHITDEDVRGAPRWDKAAPSVLQRSGGFRALAAHRAAFEQQFCIPRLTRGAQWICTWKCALRLWPDSPSFSNQGLRYWHRPEGLVREKGLPVHRALPDAYVSAHLLRDMLALASPEQLVEWSALPGLLPRVRRGDDRGTSFEELPSDRLRQLARDRDGDVRYTATWHLERRGEGRLPQPAVTQQDLF